jgi:ketosteroid isomerase-like protein
MTTAHPIVDSYAAAINAGDLAAVTALFADGASIVHPIGTFADRDQIRDFYRDVVLAGQAALTIGDVLADGDVVMAEIVATSPLDPSAGSVHAIDVFRLAGDGRIERLKIYDR